MKKYYVEIAKTDSDYILQSDWFDTEEEALEFARKITFVRYPYKQYLMSAKGDIDPSNNGFYYGDIKCEYEIKTV